MRKPKARSPRLTLNQRKSLVAKVEAYAHKHFTSKELACERLHLGKGAYHANRKRLIDAGEYPPPSQANGQDSPDPQDFPLAVIPLSTKPTKATKATIRKAIPIAPSSNLSAFLEVCLHLIRTSK